MKKISTTIDREKDLTIHICSGELELQDLWQASERYYSGTPTKKVLWDLRGAKFESFNTPEVRSISKKVREITHSREQGKTAILVGDDLTYGLSNMYAVYAESEGHPFETKVFKKYDDAMSFLFDRLSNGAF